MARLDHVRRLSQRRKQRVSNKVRDNSERPRLRINITNKAVSAQIIDDSNGKTVASASVKKSADLTTTAQAAGTEIAKKASKAGVKKVVFDKGEYQYQKRLSAFAEAARKEGLEF